MKKFLVLFVFIIGNMLYSADNPSHSKQLKRIIKVAQEEVSSKVKRTLVIALLNKAPLYFFNVTPHFFNDNKGITEIVSVVTCGDNNYIKQYMASLDTPKKHQMVLLQEGYKRIAKANIEVTVAFYEGVYKNKELMTRFLWNNRFRDVLYPPTVMEDRYGWNKNDMVNNPELYKFFLDTVIRLPNKQLMHILLLQDPDIFKRAFKENVLSLHLAVQLKWYDMVEMILNNNPERINDRDRLGCFPGWYSDRDQKMITLLERFKNVVNISTSQK